MSGGGDAVRKSIKGIAMTFYIFLRIEMLDFLLSHITDPYLHGLLLKAKKAGPSTASDGYSAGSYGLQVSNGERGRFLVELGNLLRSIGRQPDGEPNETGRQIERIISTFSPQLPGSGLFG